MNTNHSTPAGDRSEKNIRATTEIDLTSVIDVTVVLRGKQLPMVLPGGSTVTKNEPDTGYAADKAARQLIEDHLAANDVTIVAADKEARYIVARGCLGSFQRLFNIEFADHQGASPSLQRVYHGNVCIPAALEDLIECVYGLDDALIAEPYFELGEPKKFVPRKLLRGYYPHEVGKLYNFPTETDGSGQCIAIIELGGGYRMHDIRQYYTRLGLRVPSVTHVGINGAGNAPTTVNSNDREVMLDILVAGSIAPGARIVVYFAPNNERGFYTALSKAIHDKKNKPNVLSISWGAAEKKWGKKALNSFNELFKTAAALGITVCAASGDHGSSGGIQDGNVHVDFPASSPYVLSCGGTRLLAKDDNIISEVVWHEGDNAAGGGGVSEHFQLPDYQHNCGVPLSLNPSKFKGRGVPDVAGNAAHGTGYKIVVNGKPVIIGGTSAVAPLYAGLIALLNQQQGAPVGFINPHLYKYRDLFREIVKGNNITSKPQRGYVAGAGWNACTGLGVLCKLGDDTRPWNSGKCRLDNKEH